MPHPVGTRTRRAVMGQATQISLIPAPALDTPAQAHRPCSPCVLPPLPPLPTLLAHKTLELLHVDTNRCRCPN